MSYADVQKYMGPTLSKYGFELESIEPAVEYGERPAWAVYFRGADCKLQVCWSAREGSVDFMLAPLDAPAEFGLVNKSNKWRFLLSLSDFDDGLATPSLSAGVETWWRWRTALFEAHIVQARAAIAA
ncbi:hypothetical protein [Mycobacteroides abscessus]|uniref:hypothetical protein n=1 Tax=Mycobacteroides abscessus TaxID=36809 RepID=UPI0018969420